MQKSRRVARFPVNAEIIQVNTFCCSQTSTPSSTVNRMECLNVFAKTTPSLPFSSVVATPVEMFCARSSSPSHRLMNSWQPYQDWVEIELPCRDYLQITEQRIT